MSGSAGVPATSGSSGTSGAPSAIQRVSLLISSASIGFTVASIRRGRGGHSSARMRLSIRLSSGLPGTRAGPSLPPRNMDARLRRSSSASCFRAPWQTAQRRSKMGTISCCVTSGGTAVAPKRAPPSIPATSSIRERKRTRSDESAGNMAASCQTGNVPALLEMWVVRFICSSCPHHACSLPRPSTRGPNP